MEMNSFKMFMFDVGLLTAKAGLSARLLLDGSRIFEEFKGALTEQYVAQELHAAGYPLYYLRQNVQRVKLISCCREILIASRLK